MSKMLFGFGSTFMAVGEKLMKDQQTMAYYIVFRDTGKENQSGPISADRLPDCVSADNTFNFNPEEDIMFFFRTKTQRDRVFDSFNGYDA